MTENVRISHEILSKPYSRKLTPDESGGYVATIHEFPGCIAYGETPNEAITKLEDVAESWLEAAAESNYTIPAPANYETASGRIALRISRRLHQIAVERADLEGTSLNQLIATALAGYLGQKEGIDAALSAAKNQLQDACERFTATLGQHNSQHIYVHMYGRQPVAHEETRQFIPMGGNSLKEFFTTAQLKTPLLT